MDGLSEAPLSRSELYAAEMFGSAALIVVGEPTSEEHKNAILERIAQGLSSWDAQGTGCDINAELTEVANEAPSGVSGSNGEQIVRHGSETFQLEVVFNPRRETLRESLRVLLLPPTKHKHIIFAGYTFTGTGDWVLQDGCFTFSDFASAFTQPDVEAALKEQKGSTLTVHCGTACGHWSQDYMTKSVVGHSLVVSVSPKPVYENQEGIIQFTAYLSYFIRVLSVSDLLIGSDVVGNIRFTKPTLYIFPGAQGDCAVFGIHGFNMLIDGGYSRRACFWEFARHLDRLDVLLLSRISQDNLFGVKSFLQRKLLQPINPAITYAFFNGAHAKEQAVDSPLSVSLIEEASLVSSYLKELGCKPGACFSSPSPVQLYSKIGHGSLDMYILNPTKDSSDSKEMLKQWTAHADHFSSNKAGIPLNETCSIASLLVWKSHSGEVTRILYPASTPQGELIKSLEHIKDLDVIKYPFGSKQAIPSKHSKKETPTVSRRLDETVSSPSVVLAQDSSAETAAAEDSGARTEALQATSPRDSWQAADTAEPAALPDPVLEAPADFGSQQELEARDPIGDATIDQAPANDEDSESSAKCQERLDAGVEQTDDEDLAENIMQETAETKLEEEPQVVTPTTDDQQESEQDTADQPESVVEADETVDQSKEEDLSASIPQEQQVEASEDENQDVQEPCTLDSLVEEQAPQEEEDFTKQDEEITLQEDEVDAITPQAEERDIAPHYADDVFPDEETMLQAEEDDRIVPQAARAEEVPPEVVDEQEVEEQGVAELEIKSQSAQLAEAASSQFPEDMTYDSDDATVQESLEAEHIEDEPLPVDVDLGKCDGEMNHEYGNYGNHGSFQVNQNEQIEDAVNLLEEDDLESGPVNDDSSCIQNGVHEIDQKSQSEQEGDDSDQLYGALIEDKTEEIVDQTEQPEQEGLHCQQEDDNEKEAPCTPSEEGGEPLQQAEEPLTQEVDEPSDQCENVHGETVDEQVDEGSENPHEESKNHPEEPNEDEGEQRWEEPREEESENHPEEPHEEGIDSSPEEPNEEGIESTPEEPNEEGIESTLKEEGESHAEEPHEEEAESHAEKRDDEESESHPEEPHEEEAESHPEERDDEESESHPEEPHEEEAANPSEEPGQEEFGEDPELPLKTAYIPLLSSSQEELYRRQAEDSYTKLQDSRHAQENEPGDDSSTAEEDDRHQHDFTADSMEGGDSARDVLPDREDSLEPSEYDKNEPETDKHTFHQVSPQCDEECGSPDDASDFPYPHPRDTDPMTASFLDESTSGQNVAAGYEYGHMVASAGSDESLLSSNRSVLGSTPAMADVDSIAGSHSDNAQDEDGEPISKEVKLSLAQGTQSRGQSTNLNPFAAEFTPRDFSVEHPMKDMGEASSVITEPFSNNWKPGRAPVHFKTDDFSTDEFDPLKAWGEPQNLPSPPSPVPQGDSSLEAAEGEAKLAGKKPTAASVKINGEKPKSAPAKTKSATKTGKIEQTLVSDKPGRPKPAKTKTEATNGDLKPAVAQKSHTPKPSSAPAKPKSAPASVLIKKPAAEKKDDNAPPSTDKKDIKASIEVKPKSSETKVKEADSKPKSADSKTKVAEVKSKPVEAKMKPAETKPKLAEAKKPAEPKPKAVETVKPTTPRDRKTPEKTVAKSETPRAERVEKAKVEAKTKPVAEKLKPVVDKPKSAEAKMPKAEVAPKPKPIAKPSTPASKQTTAKVHKGPVVYVDLAYVPHHGDGKFVGLEFFQFIHARYYVFSGLHTSPSAFTALLHAKDTWENKDEPVTIIATYDTDVFHHWTAVNRDQLSTLNIDIAPTANRCYVQLAEGNSSFAAYRLEF